MTNEQWRRDAAKKLASGAMSVQDFTDELNRHTEESKEHTAQSLRDAITKAVDPQWKRIFAACLEKFERGEHPGEYCGPNPVAVKRLVDDVTARVEKQRRLTSNDESETDAMSRSTSPTYDDVLYAAAEAKEGHVRIKGGDERYKTTKYVGKNRITGQPVELRPGQLAESVSDYEYAKCGAFLKFKAMRDGRGVSMTEHERELLEETFTRDTWNGVVNGRDETDIPGMRAKALLLDATSGGQELSPEFYDTAIESQVLLHSELMPFVTLKDVPRGQAIETASVNAPTLTWGQAEGSSLTLFDTTALVTEITASVASLMVAIEVGLDLLADIGRTLVDLIGERTLQVLDDKIANGSGTGEPLGLFNAGGVTTVAQQSPSPTGWDLNDVEAILFALGKEFRNNRGPALRWIMNDVNYRKICGLAVSSSDQRRLLGMDHESYSILERPVSIQNSIANTKVGFADLSRYRLWRRQGANIHWTKEGQTLGLKNTSLLIVRSRWAGKLVNSSAFVKMTTVPA